MSGVPRLLYNNLVRQATAVITVSSALDTLPKTNLLEPIASIPWRTKIGWTVTLNVNAQIPFTRSGVRLATITAGYYATSAAMCAAIVAAMEAVDSVPVWACTYSGTTHKFTISSDIAFVLNAISIVSIASVLADIGFVNLPTASATSAVADFASYQSRHWIAIDLLAAGSFDTVIALDSNLVSGGTFRLQTTNVGPPDGLDGTGFSVNQLMTQSSNGDYGGYQFSSTQSYRYLRLVIDNSRSADGYTELGIAFVGTGFLTDGVIGAEEDGVEELSEPSFASGGALHVIDRPTRHMPTLGFQIQGATELAAWQAFRAAVKIGVCFFIQIDNTDENSYLYVFNQTAIAFSFDQLTSDGKRFTTELTLKEALG